MEPDEFSMMSHNNHDNTHIAEAPGHGNPVPYTSTAVQELLNRRPGFLARWGSSIFFLILAMLLLTGRFVRYPETITTRVKLIAPSWPQAPAATGGNIDFVKPGLEGFYAIMYISQKQMARVKTGQTVFLKFDVYPYKEYGAVSGTIEDISAFVTDSGYIARIHLQNGLNTLNKKQLKFSEGLCAEAEIIIGNKLLYDIFFNSSVKN